MYRTCHALSRDTTNIKIAGCEPMDLAIFRSKILEAARNTKGQDSLELVEISSVNTNQLPSVEASCFETRQIHSSGIVGLGSWQKVQTDITRLLTTRKEPILKSVENSASTRNNPSSSVFCVPSYDLTTKCCCVSENFHL